MPDSRPILLRLPASAGAWLAALLCLLPPAAQAFQIEITEQQIQAEVGTMFPIRQQLPFVTAVFSDPRVHIVPDSDRVRLTLSLRARLAAESEVAGEAGIEGSIGYDAETGEFHLVRPSVTRLHLDLMAQESLEFIRLMANAVAEQYLTSVVIYRLDERDFRQGLLRRNLRGVEVRDGRIIAEMGW